MNILCTTRWSQVWHNGFWDQLFFPFALFKAFFPFFLFLAFIKKILHFSSKLTMCLKPLLFLVGRNIKPFFLLVPTTPCYPMFINHSQNLQSLKIFKSTYPRVGLTLFPGFHHWLQWGQSQASAERVWKISHPGCFWVSSSVQGHDQMPELQWPVFPRCWAPVVPIYFTISENPGPLHCGVWTWF